MMALGGFTLITVRFFLIGIVLNLSNEKIYNEMLKSLLRAPLSYFDANSSGSMLSKFSNDMNHLEFNMIFLLLDVIEGPIITLVMLVNMASINLLFLVPTLLCLLSFIFIFIWCKKIIVASKQLDSAFKGPVYSHVTETVSGLTTILTYGQKKMFINEYVHGNNTRLNCFKTNFPFKESKQ